MKHLIGLGVTTLIVLLCGIVESRFDGMGLVLAMILTVPNAIFYAWITR